LKQTPRHAGCSLRCEPSSRIICAAKPEISEKPMRTFDDVADAYLRSPKFHSLAHNTQRMYCDGITLLLVTFSTMPVKLIDRPKVIDFRDLHYDPPGKCKIALSTLSNVLGFAFDRGWVTLNVAKGITDLPPSTPHKRWSLTEVDRFLVSAPAHLVTAVMLA